MCLTGLTVAHAAYYTNSIMMTPLANLEFRETFCKCNKYGVFFTENVNFTNVYISRGNMIFPTTFATCLSFMFSNTNTELVIRQLVSCMYTNHANATSAIHDFRRCPERWVFNFSTVWQIATKFGMIMQIKLTLWTIWRLLIVRIFKTLRWRSAASLKHQIKFIYYLRRNSTDRHEICYDDAHRPYEP